MSELRRDGLTGEWVMIAPERSRRPQPSSGADGTSAPVPKFDPSCPFCPGNEAELAGIVEELPDDAPPGWRTRVVFNKFPAVRPENGTAPAADAKAIAAHGFHEVIIESSRHDADLTTVPEDQLMTVLRTYQRRFVELAARPGIKSVLVFRNHGARAGASVPHPHAQVIATDMTPPRTAATAAWARLRYAQEGQCPACAEIAGERDDGRRIVEETEHFVAMVPFAAASPCEQWILPGSHQVSFAECGDEDIVEFGRLLQRSLRRLSNVLDDPPYNFVIETGVGDEADSAFTHWWLRIVPHIVTPAGFELGAGMRTNPSLPEDDAARLRAAAVTPPNNGS